MLNHNPYMADYLSENRAAADMQAISSLQSPSYIVELQPMMNKRVSASPHTFIYILMYHFMD